MTLMAEASATASSPSLETIVRLVEQSIEEQRDTRERLDAHIRYSDERFRGLEKLIEASSSQSNAQFLLLSNQFSDFQKRVGQIEDHVGFLTMKVVEHDKRFDAIDERLKAHDKRFNGIDRRLDAHDKRFDGIDQRLDGIDQRLDGIDQRLDGIDKRLDAHDKRFDAIDQRLDGIDKQLDAHDKRFDGIDQRLDDIDKRLEAHDKRFDAIDNRLEAHEKRFDSVDAQLLTIAKGVADLQQTLTAQKG